MVNYLFGIVGIAVSVILFFVGYRQTIGARKERMEAANTELGRVLLRRVVLEGFSPGRIEIDRLRDGTSREYRVAVSDILLPVELMNTVYTKIIENDFISPDLRKGILDKFNPLCDRLSREEDQEPDLGEDKSVSSVLPVAFGLLTSLLGAAVAVLPQLRTIALDRKHAIELVLTIGAVSFTIIVSYLLFNRLRDQQEENPSRNPALEGYEFEREVASTIRKTGLSVRSAPIQAGYDFEIVTKSGEKVLIEAKAWAKRTPTVYVRHLVQRLSDLVALRVRLSENIWF
jgi:hypothetical protein